MRKIKRKDKEWILIIYKKRRWTIEMDLYDLVDDFYEGKITLEAAEHYAFQLLKQYYSVIKELKEIGGWY